MSGRDRRLQGCTWIALALGILWIGLFPLLLVRRGDGILDWSLRYSYSGFTQTKRDTMWLLSGLTLPTGVLMLALGAWRRVKWQQAGRLLCVGCFCWMGLSAVFGSAAGTAGNNGGMAVWDGAIRYEGMSTQLCYLTVFLVLSLVRPKVKWIAAGAAAGLTVYAAVTFLQYGGGNPLGLYPRGRSIMTNYEFQGTIGNIDMGIGYLVMAAALLIGCYVVYGGRFGTVMLPFGLLAVLLIMFMEVNAGLLGVLAGAGLLVLLALCRPQLRSRCMIALGGIVLCLFLRQITGLPWLDGLADPWYCTPRTDAPELPSLTGAEQIVFPWHITVKKLALLAAAGLIAASALLFRKHPGPSVRLRWPLLALAVLAAGGLLCLRFAPVPASAGTLYQIHELLCGRGLDTFGSERLGVWRHTLHIAKENLLFGTGPDTFLSVFRTHLRAEGATLSQTFDNPHNLFLAILMQNGLPALLFYIGGMAFILCRAARSRDGLPLCAAVLCYLVQGMFTFSIVIVTPIFWALLGMAAALDDRHELPV